MKNKQRTVLWREASISTASIACTPIDTLKIMRNKLLPDPSQFQRNLIEAIIYNSTYAVTIPFKSEIAFSEEKEHMKELYSFRKTKALFTALIRKNVCKPPPVFRDFKGGIFSIFLRRKFYAQNSLTIGKIAKPGQTEVALLRDLSSAYFGHRAQDSIQDIRQLACNIGNMLKKMPKSKLPLKIKPKLTSKRSLKLIELADCSEIFPVASDYKHQGQAYGLARHNTHWSSQAKGKRKHEKSLMKTRDSESKLRNHRSSERAASRAKK